MCKWKKWKSRNIGKQKKWNNADKDENAEK